MTLLSTSLVIRMWSTFPPTNEFVTFSRMRNCLNLQPDLVEIQENMHNTYLFEIIVSQYRKTCTTRIFWRSLCLKINLRIPINHRNFTLKKMVWFCFSQASCNLIEVVSCKMFVYWGVLRIGPFKWRERKKVAKKTTWKYDFDIIQKKANRTWVLSFNNAFKSLTQTCHLSPVSTLWVNLCVVILSPTIDLCLR